jgi:uncharacterized protein
MYHQPFGIVYDESGIQTALDLRYLYAKARRRGVYGIGPKPFNSVDRSKL